ncbi:MAG: phage major tail protein, TP901-1 family [Synergistes sp.]|nr:phage major tail protein, TP901-1 family [Synergistes sp.]
MAVTLPDNPSTSNAQVGKDFLVYINTGTAAEPTWTLVGGQRSGTLNREADSIDVSYKASDGWKASKAGLRGWSLELGTLVMLSDTGIEALATAFESGKEVNLKFEQPNSSYYTGWGSITSFSLSTPHDGAAEISGTVEGNGALSFTA